MVKCYILSSRSAILVLIWDTLMYSHLLFLRYSVASYFSTTHHKYSEIVFDICYCLVFLSFPLVGLLADVWIGRYKAITAGIIICFVSWINSGIGYILEQVSSSSLTLVVFIIAYILEVIGYASFRANIIQYNIGQLVGASADELSTVIYWHCLNIPLAVTFFQLFRCLIGGPFVLPSFILSGVSVSIVLVTHSFFKHWLESFSLIDNPIKLIVRVINYARKHKYPENRSALTYWEEEVPSRLDLGKQKYGGPFSEEEVENVKTIFRMTPLLISVIGYGCIDEIYWRIMSGDVHNHHIMIINRFLLTDSFNYLAQLIFFGTYFLSLLCLRKYLPSMLKRICLGLVIAVCSMVSYTVILRFGDNIELIVPQILRGITYVLIYSTSLEFTIAQCPVEMRGVMVGMWYASMGIGYLININIKYPFGCTNDVLCTSFKYYATKAGIVFLILIVFVILAKYYKFRVRENEVNIHQIVDDHYQRYMEQEEHMSQADVR